MSRFGKIGAAALVAAAIAGAAPAAFAGQAPKAAQASQAVTSGTCSAGSTWKLTVKPDAGKIEADLEIQTNTAGQTWGFRMWDNGTLFAQGSKTTIADGSFSVTRRTTNLAGTDRILVKARNRLTGEVCKAAGSY